MPRLVRSRFFSLLSLFVIMSVISVGTIEVRITSAVEISPSSPVVQESSEPGLTPLEALTPQQRAQLQTVLDRITTNRQKLSEVRCRYRVTLGPIGPEESRFLASFEAMESIQTSTHPSRSSEESASVASPVVHEGVWLHSAARQATCLTLRCDPSIIKTNRRARNAWVSAFFDDTSSSSAESLPVSDSTDYRPCYDEQFLQYQNHILTYSELINTGNLYIDSKSSLGVSGTPFDARIMGIDGQESPEAYLRQILDGSPMPQLGKIQIKIDEIKFKETTAWRLTILCDAMRWECTFIPERDWLPIRLVRQPSNASSEIPLTAAIMEVVEFGQTDALWYPKRLISINSKPQDVPLQAAWYEVDSLTCGESAAITDATFATDFSLSLPTGAKIVRFKETEDSPTWITLSSDMEFVNSSTNAKVAADSSATCCITATSLSTLAEQIRTHGHPISAISQSAEASSDKESKQEQIREELRQLAEKQTADTDPNAVKRRIYGHFLDDPKNQTAVVFCTVCTILIIIGIRMIMRRRAIKRQTVTRSQQRDKKSL